MSAIDPDFRAFSIGLATLALAGLLLVVAVSAQRAPAPAPDEDTSMGDVPYLPPAALRRA